MGQLNPAIIPVTPFQQNCTILFDEEEMVGVVVDPGGDVAGERPRDVSYRNETRFRNATRQIARVDAAEAAEANQSNVQPAHRPPAWLTSSLVRR